MRWLVPGSQLEREAVTGRQAGESVWRSRGAIVRAIEDAIEVELHAANAIIHHRYMYPLAQGPCRPCGVVIVAVVEEERLPSSSPAKPIPRVLQNHVRWRVR